jgi:predicted PurR-regulated permease PerM
MAEQSISHRGTRLLVIAASLVIIIWGINQAQAVVVLFLVSIFLAILGAVPVGWMERKRVPRVAAVLIVLAGMVTLLLSIGVVVGASLNNFSDALPSYQTRLHTMLSALKAFMASKGIAISDAVLFGYANPGAVMSMTASMFTALGSVLSNIVLILFTAMFILLEASSFTPKLRSVRHNSLESFSQFRGFGKDIRRYIAIKTLLNLVGAALTTIWLYYLGVDFPVLWGVLAFLLHFIPSIGSVVAAVPAVLLALVQLGEGSAVLTAAGYLVIGMIIGNVVEPRIMGRKLGMSTLVVFVSLIFWGYVLGLVGALLCVPLTMTLKLAFEANEETRWIAVLLEHENAPERTPGAPKEDT